MSIADQLNQDVDNALRSQDQTTLSTLRLLKNSIDSATKEKKSQLTDEEVVKVLQKEAKQRRDSIEGYKQGDRQDLADKESVELKLIETYLPQQMSEAELGAIVDAAIAETGASSPADMGKVMQAVMAKAAGKADGGVVSQLVKQKLSG